VKPDPITKSIASACYESYDKDLWINEKSKVWVLKKEYTEVNRSAKYPKYFQIDKQDKKIDVILKWFNKKFTLNVGSRNANLYKLARALNTAGSTETQTTEIFKNFYTSGLSEKELEDIITSAYKNTQEFNTLVLIDDNKIKEASETLKKGIQRAKRDFKSDGLNDHDIEDIIEFDFETDFLIFWDTDKNGKIFLNDYKFKLFLENRGFYKVQLNEKEYTFVKVYNNIIREINEVNIKDFVLDHVVDVNIDVYNFFAKSTNKFSDNYLNQLATKELSMLRDTAETSYLYFRNLILKVTKDKIEAIDYINSGGFVWEKNIIQHNFNIKKTESDFKKFILNISNYDQNRVDVLETSIGYLLNNFKKQDEGLAIILYDETLNDNPSGRTGKTLISKAISHVRKLVTLNGKEFNNKGQFPYQTINLDDNVICFDDLERSFKFETLFSIITGNLVLNKKNLQPIEIPYAQSPKILFTSNYILSGTGDSHDARKLEIELFRHYSKTYKPVDEFGKLFFDEWNDKEWNAFYHYMIELLQKYLTFGLLHSDLTTGKTKKLIANTCEDFYDFCENEFLFSENKNYTTKEILSAYNNGQNEMPQRMNVSWFGRWLSSYFDFKEWKREDSNYNGQRSFIIVGCGSKEYNNEIDF